MRTSRICSPSSSAWTIAAHSLQAGCHVPTIGGPWTTRSCPETSSCPPTWRVAEPAACRASGSCSATASQPAARRGDRRHHLSRPRRPHRERGGWTVLTFNFRGTGTSEGDFSAQRLARRPARRGARAARASRRARRVDRGLRSRRHVRGVRRGRRPPGARRGDDRVAEHVARLGAGSRSPARARTCDGHDPQRGVPDRPDALGARHRTGRRRSPRPSASIVVRCSCCTACEDVEVPVDDARAPRRRRPAQLGAAAGAGCGPPPAPRPAGDRHPARLARPPGPERRLDRDPDRTLPRFARLPGERQPSAAARTASRVSSSECSGCHPVAATSLPGSPTSTGHVDRRARGRSR